MLQTHFAVRCDLRAQRAVECGHASQGWCDSGPAVGAHSLGASAAQDSRWLQGAHQLSGLLAEAAMVWLFHHSHREQLPWVACSPGKQASTAFILKRTSQEERGARWR